jgi:hypothetical protein
LKAARVWASQLLLPKIAPMNQTAIAPKTVQINSLRAIRWAVAVERQNLSAAIGDAMREVLKAERLLAAGVDVDDAARSLNAWTAILDSRITRLNSFELRYRRFKLPAHSTSVEAAQFGNAQKDRGAWKAVGASTGSDTSVEMKNSPQKV